MLRHRKASVQVPKGLGVLEENPVAYFSLDGLLPSNTIFALYGPHGTLSLLESRDGQASILNEQQFTTIELSVLLPLLVFYPDYAPYEVLFASFYQGSVQERIVAKSKRYLEAIASREEWAQEMRRLRDTVQHLREKLAVFDLHISTIRDQGYGFISVLDPIQSD